MTGAENESSSDWALRAAEYTTVRTEILKLIELQSQLVSLAVLAVGALLAAAVQQRNANLAFVYPLLTLILGVTWLNHAHAVRRCARYQHEVIEPAIGGAIGWEHFVEQHPLRLGKLGYWGVRSVFAASSLVAILVGWSMVRPILSEVALGVVSSLLTLATIVLFAFWRETSPEKERATNGAQLNT